MTEHRFGRVSGQDPEGCRVRVAFGAEDELVSWWLPVLQPCTGGDKLYRLPGLGDYVLCLLDENAEDGVVLGGVFTEADRPPVASLDKVHLRMGDGAVLEYDRAEHRLEVTLPAGGSRLQVSVNGDVELAVPAGKNVFLGSGEGALRVATEEHVRSTFLLHKHPVGGPGLSGPPVPTGAELQFPQVSSRARVV
jgi:phage baseplate assembly protein V